ncbi:MAG: hypothetical protein AB1925_18625 [Actinomycetota bacterium]
MSRRDQGPWSVTRAPDLRRHWCTQHDQLIDRFATALAPQRETLQPSTFRRRRLQDQLAASLEIMRAESDALARANLYWAARGMVDLTLQAAPSLPAWTPTLAVPCPNGLLYWAKPAGTIPFGPRATATANVAWDALWWWTRPDGMLQITPASRLLGHRELLQPFGINPPLWPAHMIVIDPQRPRSEEANGTEDMHPFVSAAGAAWLLMGQPAHTSARTFDGQTTAQPPHTSPRKKPRTASVTIIDIHPPAPREHGDNQAGHPVYRRRWWVEGHWRQQVCGPQMTQRRPTWIAPHIKGPPNAPLTTDRVHVWRR